MIFFKDQIEYITEQIVSKYNPLKIILFGSCAKECVTKNSDIDLCIICEYEDKKKMLIDMLMHIESEKDIDLILYRPTEWERYKEDTTTFASIINRKGMILYG